MRLPCSIISASVALSLLAGTATQAQQLQKPFLVASFGAVTSGGGGFGAHVGLTGDVFAGARIANHTPVSLAVLAGANGGYIGTSCVVPVSGGLTHSPCFPQMPGVRFAGVLAGGEKRAGSFSLGAFGGPAAIATTQHEPGYPPSSVSLALAGRVEAALMIPRTRMGLSFSIRNLLAPNFYGTLVNLPSGSFGIRMQ